MRHDGSGRTALSRPDEPDILGHDRSVTGGATVHTRGDTVVESRTSVSGTREPGDEPGDQPGDQKPRREGLRPDEARFQPPRLPRHHVSRPRLLDRLAQADDARVVLVSAPAGTGKTTLVAEWLARASPDVVWVTFERRETDFWRQVLRGLAGVVTQLPATWSVPGAATLGRARLVELAERLRQRPRALTLVVDGYELTSRSLGDELDDLLGLAEGRLRLVLVSRVDPVMPLYRYLLDDALVEVRGHHLAFTHDEAAQLVAAAGTGLDRDQVELLNSRVAGWATGLRLATLPSAAAPVEAVAVAARTGSSVIHEWLVAEVLDAQPGDLRRLMLDASVPDGLSASLAAEIGGPTAPAACQRLAGLGILVEDDPTQPGWFRFPPFFRDLLRARLDFESPARCAEVHRSVARWLRREGLVAEGLHHLAEAGDWDEVSTEIIERMLVGELLVEGERGTLGVVAARLPAATQDARHCLVRSAVALAAGDNAQCVRELNDARRYAATASGLPRWFDESAAVVEALWASRAQDARSETNAVRIAEGRVRLPLLGSSAVSSSDLRAVVAFAKGHGALRQDETRAAVEALVSCVDHLPDHPSTFRVMALGYLALAHALAGELEPAVTVAHLSLLQQRDAGLSPADLPPAAHVALALVAMERLDQPAALAHTDAARASNLLDGYPVCRSYRGLAVIWGERLTLGTSRTLTRLESLAAAAATHDPRIADRLRREGAVWTAASGRADEAQEWIERIIEPDRPPARIVAAIVRAEQGAEAPGPGSAPPPPEADEPEPVRVAVERHLLVASQLLGTSRRRAQAELDAALRLAEPHRLRRPFVETGPQVRLLLEAETGLVGRHRWLASDPDRPGPTATGLDARSARPAPNPLIEPLTPKEQEVLELLAELLTTEEIAQKLFVSVNTVRTHIRSLLRKLGVNRRNAAIRRAKDLGLLTA